jgi:hypothetical protein
MLYAPIATGFSVRYCRLKRGTASHLCNSLYAVLLPLQYDIIKRMERMGKSVGMIAGQAEPTIIQPSQYRKRFSLAMERYFMTIPDKWITHET